MPPPLPATPRLNLLEAILSSNLAAAEDALSKGATLDPPPGVAYTSLFQFAVTYAKPGLLCRLAREKPDLTVQDIFGFGILHTAVRRGDLEIVRLVVEWGTPLNLLTKSGCTARDAAGVVPRLKPIADYLHAQGALTRAELRSIG